MRSQFCSFRDLSSCFHPVQSQTVEILQLIQGSCLEDGSLRAGVIPDIPSFGAKCETEILPACDVGLQGPDPVSRCGLLFF